MSVAGRGIVDVPVDRYGEVVEWFKAAVLKTVEVRASVGSNPTLSAIIILQEHPRGARCFFVRGFGRDAQSGLMLPGLGFA